MKYIEIILKLLFVVGAVMFFTSRDFFMMNICWFLVISLILGVTLFFNKKQSYGYELAHREVTMRKIEGVVLAVFAVVFGILRTKGII